MTTPKTPVRRDLTGGLGAVKAPGNVEPVSLPEPPVAGSGDRFKTVPVAAADLDRLEANQAPVAPKRERATGRNIPFTTRLRKDTMEYIYGQANSRNIPIAAVIEELVEAHRKTASGEGR